MSELRILRDRQRAAREALDSAQGDAPPHGSAAILGVTTTVTTYPTAAPAYFAVQVNDVNGAEDEGASAGYASASDGAIVLAYNVGKKVPPEGTPVVCHAVGGRWVFRYDLAPT